MRLENGYLSDEELEQLILDVEQYELVVAPPEIAERVLDSIDVVERNSNHEPKANRPSENKVREFRSYCFRVLTSVAAAVAIVFLIPGLQSIQLPEMFEKQTRIVSDKYTTEKDALSDAGMLTRTLGGVRIFDNNNRFKIFSK